MEQRLSARARGAVKISVSLPGAKGRKHEKTHKRRVHRPADIAAAQISIAHAAGQPMHRMRRTGRAGVAMLETPGQGPGAPAQEARA